ncbi:MAG: hypothetical protein ACHQ50_15455 [Fimbriimonadales bacterium]
MQVAATDRLQDAEVLFAQGRFASSIAMGVYSLEIHLKALICKRLNLKALPIAFEIHDLDGLLVLCGLQAACNSAPAAVQQNWTDISDKASKINDFRYLPSSNWNQTLALAFLQQLRDPPDGVLPWLLAQP